MKYHRKFIQGRGAWALALLSLFVAPAWAQETQLFLGRQAPPSFAPGQPIEITITISAAGPGNITAIGVYETLPPNWTFSGLRGITADPPSISPAPGQTDLLEFAWITPPPFPVMFAYTLLPPEQAGGVQYITGQVEYRESGGALKSNVEFTELSGPDNRPPTIQLLGENPAVVEQGSAWSDPGATASDETDGDLSNQIQRSGQVNTNQPGSYAVEYSVVDSAGNRATATRTVEVVERTSGGGGGASPRPRAPAYNRDLYSGGGRPNPQRPNTPRANAPEPARTPESVLAAEAALSARTVPQPAAVTNIPDGVGEAPAVTGGDRRPLDQARLQQIVGRISGKGGEKEDSAGAAADSADAASEGAAASSTADPSTPSAGDSAPQVAAIAPVSAQPPTLGGQPADRMAALDKPKPAAPGFAARVGARVGRMGVTDVLLLLGAVGVVVGIGAVAGYGWRSAYRTGKRRPGSANK